MLLQVVLLLTRIPWCIRALQSLIKVNVKVQAGHRYCGVCSSSFVADQYLKYICVICCLYAQDSDASEDAMQDCGMYKVPVNVLPISCNP